MTKEDFMKLYDELGWTKIEDLYNYSCLITSGFEKDKAYELKDLLNELWLKDENNYSISKLSDMLYDIYDNIEDGIDEMATREVLREMYESEW